MNYDSITEIDIHGMRPEEAVRTLSRLIDGAPDTVYRIRVIHGYHRGNALQKAIYDEFNYFHTSDRVLRMEGGSNPGITDIILREW
jgi:DNA-nicking Smr family endonuclease